MRTKPRPTSERAAATNLAEVKRRFIRQNRELAKHNSTQSLKIRGLEGEVSKLLAQNLELRERNLDLEHRLEKGEGKQNGGVMRELKRKLEELSGLVQGLQGDDEGEYVRESMDVQQVLSPSRQQYRERQPLAELMQENQMPTIDEGKSFPRQTMDAMEIRALRISDGSAATGSPDLGPPPVARFDCEEIKNGDAEEELLPSVNLETRRRRKDGPSEREIRRSSILALSPVKLDVEPAATSMLRTGAKRKLADRDLERATEKADFNFTRKSLLEQQQENDSRDKVVDKTVNEPITAPVSPAKPAPRRVLGDKSVNMSPRKTAPAKAGKPSKEDLPKPKPAPRSQSTARPVPRGRRVSSAPQLSEQPPAVASIELPAAEISLPPKTPAPPFEDPFSPSTASASQPPTAPMNRDTPPPSHLSSLSNTTTDARPSRRARSSVNYAEPSLVAKMRRPGKGMVDAISGLPAARRSSVDATRKEVVIKVEPVDEDEWAKEGSPLREKSKTSTNTSSASPPELADDKIAVTQPKRRESLTVAESRKKREAIRTSSTSKSPPTVEAAAEKLAEMDLYDFKDDEQGSSSPATATAKDVVVGKGRRHSSVLKDVGGVKMVGVTAGNSDIGRAAAAGRRRSMML